MPGGASSKLSPKQLVSSDADSGFTLSGSSRKCETASGSNDKLLQHLFSLLACSPLARDAVTRREHDSLELSSGRRSRDNALIMLQRGSTGLTQSFDAH